MDIPQLPMQLAFEDAKAAMFTSTQKIINDYQLPFFMMDIILTEILDQIREASARDREILKQQFNAQLTPQIEEYDTPSEKAE